MKKVLMAHSLHDLLKEDETFLKRSDMQVFIASSNDDMLRIHREERADLIMTKLDMPGMPTDQLCTLIREDETLRTVSLILTCANTPETIKQSSRCRANAVLLEPLHPVLLTAKAQQLLFIAARETLRVLLSANVHGETGDGAFYCRTRNISASGMLIETDQRLAENSRLVCQFYLPTAKKIRAAGKIVRIIDNVPGEEYQYGLMFTDIAPEEKQMISAYVEETAGALRTDGS